MTRTDWWLGVALLSVAALSPTLMRAAADKTSAWVLWEKNVTTKEGGGTTQWEAIDGFESLTRCQRSGQQIMQIGVDAMKQAGGQLLGDVRPDGRSAMFAVNERGAQQSVEWRYLCFPGTFDPR
jgi:hypothetical protein